MAAIENAEMLLAGITFLHGLFDLFIKSMAKYDILRLCLVNTPSWELAELTAGKYAQ
jgi:hypothetical protein